MPPKPDREGDSLASVAGIPYRSLVESLPQIVWSADGSGAITFANRRWLDYTGLSLEETLGAGGFAAIHPDDMAGAAGAWAAALASPAPVATEYRIRAADGSYRWFGGSAEPIRDADGRVTAWVGAWTDIDERRRAEEEVRALNANLERRVAERTEELAARTATLEAFEALSQELAVGSEPRSLIGHVQEIVMQLLPGASYTAYFEPEGDRWRVRALRGQVEDPVMRAGLEAGFGLAETGNLTTPWMTRQPFYQDAYDSAVDKVPEVTRTLGASATLPVIVKGEPRGVLGVALLHEHRVWSSPDRAVLETAARSLSGALERAELVRELESRNAEQETFVYTVSHDLRAPLLSIEGMSELLEDAVQRGDSEEAAFLLGRVRTNVSRMSQLLSDLLALSRIGRARGEPEVIDLRTAVGAALAELEPLLAARGVTVQSPESCPAVRYQPSELGQVLTNLLSNAAKWAGRAGRPPRVVLDCEARGRYVELKVADSGPGIGEQYRERVWDLFVRLDASSEGTGVGLAIVKRIVERHGGRAWVEDSDLGGACFVVTLPSA